MIKKTNRTAAVLAEKKDVVLNAWADAQLQDPRTRTEGRSREQFRAQFERFLDALIAATSSGNLQDIKAPEYVEVRKILTDIAVRQERSGSTSFETAASVISLKDHWVPHLQAEYADKPELLNNEIVIVSRLVDTLALTTLEAMISRREEIIAQQGREILELSTPVVQV